MTRYFDVEIMNVGNFDVEFLLSAQICEFLNASIYHQALHGHYTTLTKIYEAYMVHVKNFKQTVKC